MKVDRQSNDDEFSILSDIRFPINAEHQFSDFIFAFDLKLKLKADSVGLAMFNEAIQTV